MTLILLKYWKQLIIIGALLASLYGGFLYVKNIGYKEAESKYTEIIASNERAIEDKSKSIEIMSNVLVEQQKLANTQLTTSINSIMMGLKGKTLTIIKNGECTPSQTFSDSFQEINKRVNESIK
jgi:hypothetical protein